MPGCEVMASRLTDCVIWRAIVEAANSLGYATICELQAKAISSIVAGKDVFLSPPTGIGLFVSLLYHWSLTTSLATNKAPRQA